MLNRNPYVFYAAESASIQKLRSSLSPYPPHLHISSFFQWHLYCMSRMNKSHCLLGMGLYKERPWSKLWRGAKILFFLLNMLASLLLVCAPPLLIVLLDVLLPSALLSSFSVQLKTYRFDKSLVDVPLVSMARSLIILCAYVICEGRGPYLGIATVCGFGTIGFVMVKAAMMFGTGTGTGTGTVQGRHLLAIGVKECTAVKALFLCSLGLAVAHVHVAYRTSSREQRKLLVYKIDIEAVKLKDIRI